MFNSGRYLDHLRDGRLKAVVVKSRHPCPPLANEPHCTLSQMISYRDAGNNEVARVHQYLRRDGTIGASGKPDPKRLVHKGVLYIVGKETPG